MHKIDDIKLKEPYTLYKFQKDTIEWTKKRESNGKGVIISLQMGMGKCLAGDTPVLLWNGSIKKARNIRVGDLLIGDDSTPRKVLSICKGKDKMYKVSQNKGDDYIVNEPHILSLKVTGHKSIYWSEKQKRYNITWFDKEAWLNDKKFKYKKKIFSTPNTYKTQEEAYQAVLEYQKTISEDDVIDISVSEYMKLSNTHKELLKGYKVGVEFPQQHVDIDPYVLGLWLGDGSSCGRIFTNTNPELIEVYKNYVESIDCKFKVYSNSIDYRISGKKYRENYFYNMLKKHNLIKNKHIPMIYKVNSREVRLKLLAGLIDTDGYRATDGHCCEITQKNKSLADDILYLVRSLGFNAVQNKVKKTCNHTNSKGEKINFVGEYYKCVFSGEGMENIPTLLERKKFNKRSQKKNVNVTNIKVEECGIDDYFGFEIDGNRRFLLGDFTVTHNTICSLVISLLNPGETTLIVCSKSIMGEWINEMNKFFGTNISALIYHSEFLEKKKYDNITVKDLRNYNVVITTYDVLINVSKNYTEEILIRGYEGLHKDKIIGYKRRLEVNGTNIKGPEAFYCLMWSRVILDEAQRICNHKTKAFLAVNSLVAKYRICLSGTPIRNRDKEMWSLLWFCGFSYINNPKNWRYHHFNYYGLGDSLLQMDYSSTGFQMPDKRVLNHKTTMSTLEYSVYSFYFNELWDEYTGFIKDSKGKKFAVILGLFTRLRQICIAPYLITNESKQEQSKKDMEKLENSLCAAKETNDEELIAEYENKIANYHRTKLKDDDLEKYVHSIKKSGYNSTKTKLIRKIISEIPSGEKIIVFSIFSSYLDMLYNCLRKEDNVKSKILILNGKVSGKRRMEYLNTFRYSSDYNILLCNYKVAAEGLNLTEANHVITVEPWWNSIFEDQAISRCWRMGQKRTVIVHRLIVKGTIEEKILEMCQAKKTILESYFTGTEKNRLKPPTLDKETLGKILGIYNTVRY